MGFFDLPPRTLIIIATLISLSISEELNYQQQNALGNFLQLIGQALETTSAQNSLQTSKIQDLEKEINELKKSINKMSRIKDNF